MGWYLFFFSITFLEDSAFVAFSGCVLFQSIIGTQSRRNAIYHYLTRYVNTYYIKPSASSESQTLSYKGASYLF